MLIQCTLKGRLGREPGDLAEMRVLNRVVRVVPTGLRYEPDPRHAELLIRALNLEGGKPSTAPGSKIPFDEVVRVPGELEDIDNIVAAVRLHKNTRSKVSFSPNVSEIGEAPAWYHTCSTFSVLHGHRWSHR